MSDPPRCSGCNRLSPTTLRDKGSGIYWCGRTGCLWRVRELVQARQDGTAVEPEPRVSARWAGGGRIRIKARRGAVTTEGLFTEAEARQLRDRLTVLLQPRNAWIPPDPDGLPPPSFPRWRKDEIARRGHTREG